MSLAPREKCKVGGSWSKPKSDVTPSKNVLFQKLHFDRLTSRGLKFRPDFDSFSAQSLSRFGMEGRGSKIKDVKV